MRTPLEPITFEYKGKKYTIRAFLRIDSVNRPSSPEILDAIKKIARYLLDPKDDEEAKECLVSQGFEELELTMVDYEEKSCLPTGACFIDFAKLAPHENDEIEPIIIRENDKLKAYGIATYRISSNECLGINVAVIVSTTKGRYVIEALFR